LPNVAKPDLKAFGDAVNRARCLQGWTLDQLGAAINPPMTKYALSRIENGRREISRLTIGKLIKALNLPDYWIDRFPDAPTSEADEAATDSVVEDLLDRASADPSRPSTSEELLLLLAEEFAAEAAHDPQSAYNGLRNALAAARRVIDRGEMPSNLDDQVKAVLVEVSRLVSGQNLDQAGALIDRELARLADEVAERNQARGTLLETAIDLARARNDPAAAARHIQSRLALDTPADPFNALRAEHSRWLVSGRDQGLNFDLTVSIHLAKALVAAAADAGQRGAALNDLGNSCGVLGQREGNTDRLGQALSAYRAALQHFKQDRTPLQWAGTQSNLGNALRALGEREGSTDRLEQAVTACREALKEYRQDREPQDWATTQNNLGAAFMTLGQRDGSTDRMEQAVTAFREALKERRQDRTPLQWAGTQHNLANALRTLGEREDNTDRLEQAVTAFREALKERSQDRVPLDWAKTQNNLGNALRALGERKGGTDRLEQAVTAHREALKEYTQDRAPLDWAATQNNLGIALANLGQRERRTDRLEQAVTAYREALKEYTQDRVPLNWAGMQNNLALLDLAFHHLAPDPARLQAARDKALAARQIYASAMAAGYLAMVDRTLAKIDAAEQAAKG
jgi:tetratricopeptide (TPR) repeat protein